MSAASTPDVFITDEAFARRTVNSCSGQSATSAAGIALRNAVEAQDDGWRAASVADGASGFVLVEPPASVNPNEVDSQPTDIVVPGANLTVSISKRDVLPLERDSLAPNSIGSADVISYRDPYAPAWGTSSSASTLQDCARDLNGYMAERPCRSRFQGLDSEVAAMLVIVGDDDTCDVSLPNSVDGDCDGLSEHLSWIGATVALAPADLTVDKSAPEGSHLISDQFDYTISVENSGDSPASSVFISDAVPAGLDVVVASGVGWTCSVVDQDVDCDSDSDIDGVSIAEPITTTAPDDGGTFLNRAEVMTSTEEAADDDDEASSSATVDAIPIETTTTSTVIPTSTEVAYNSRNITYKSYQPFGMTNRYLPAYPPGWPRAPVPMSWALPGANLRTRLVGCAHSLFGVRRGLQLTWRGFL